MQAAGTGRIVLEASGDDAVFSELSYAYPLKLLSPRCVAEHVGVAYVLNYGGGLVGGDEIDLAIDVRPGTRLLLLTQVGIVLPVSLSLLRCSCWAHTCRVVIHCIAR